MNKILFSPKNFIYKTINEYTSVVNDRNNKYIIVIPCNTKILISTSIGEYQNIYHDVIYKCLVLHWGDEPNKQLYNIYTFVDLKNIKNVY